MRREWYVMWYHVCTHMYVRWCMYAYVCQMMYCVYNTGMLYKQHLLCMISGKCVHQLLGHTQSVMALVVLPKGRLLASGSWDHDIRLWNLSTGQCPYILRGHDGSVLSLVCVCVRQRERENFVCVWERENFVCLWERENCVYVRETCVCVRGACIEVCVYRWFFRMDCSPRRGVEIVQFDCGMW